MISNWATIDHTAQYADGLTAMPSAVVNKFCLIGEQCLLNTSCTLDHECTTGHGVHPMPASAIAGRVSIGDFTSIGTNATFLPDIKIGMHPIVGAGAVVTRHVSDGAIVAGVPAERLAKTSKEQRFLITIGSSIRNPAAH